MNGVLLIALGDKLYARLATVCAASIKMHSGVRVGIITSNGILDDLTPGQRGLFDDIITIPIDSNIPKSVMRVKTELYKMSPYDNTLYLDADTVLCPGKNINVLFKELEGSNFSIQNCGYNDSNSDKKDLDYYPIWGNVESIRRTYGLTNDEKIPISNSSLIWFKKSHEALVIFDTAHNIFNDENKFKCWRGEKPDEFCFNISLAKNGVDCLHRIPFEPVYIYFTNTERSKEYIVDNYWFLTTIGNRVTDARIIKTYNDFTEYYFGYFGFNKKYLYEEKEPKTFFPPSSEPVAPYKIGIGITTCGRSEIFNNSFEHINKFLPIGSKVYVNDDSEKRDGIALSKNNCLAALDGCDYIFLFDDDCYPIKSGWEKIFIDASIRTGNQHFCLTFDTLHDGGKNGNSFIGDFDGLSEYCNPCGIVLFFTRACIDICGGMDCDYKIWGGEHSGFSRRIYNTGLTQKRFLCPVGAMDNFYSYDYYRGTIGVIGQEEKATLDKVNNETHKEECHSVGFKPYKKGNYILSIYLTGAKRIEGSFSGVSDIVSIKKWAASLQGTSFTGIVFHNCFTPEETYVLSEFPVKFIKVNPPQDFMSGMYRFELYDKFIKKYSRYIENIFFTDSTDLEILQDPTEAWGYSKKYLYVGCEPVNHKDQWMLNHCQGFDRYKRLVGSNPKFADSTLLNAGLVGGHIDTVAPFIERVSDECIKLYPIADVQDMAIINYVAFTEFFTELSYGEHLNTRFKGYEKNNTTAWFKHK